MEGQELELEDQLVSELWARDVRFLMGDSSNPTPSLTPEILIKSLAESSDARLRLSLIPLLLRHPEFANEAKKIDEQFLNTNSQLFFRCYFTAAMLLQQKYQEQLLGCLGSQPKIPDLFSSKLEIILSQNPDIALFELAERHKILSNQNINWLGTYKHATDVWLKQLELHQQKTPLPERERAG